MFIMTLLKIARSLETAKLYSKKAGMKSAMPAHREYDAVTHVIL